MAARALGLVARDWPPILVTISPLGATRERRRLVGCSCPLGMAGVEEAEDGGSAATRNER